MPSAIAEKFVARILVCEDSSVFRKFLVQGLASYGFYVCGVQDGVELDVVIQDESFDIVLLDVLLPGEDGFSILARLRSRFTNLGIIMLTQVDPLEERIRGLEGGADAYFVKPVDFRELAAAIKSLLRRLKRPSPDSSFWRLDQARSLLISPGGQEILLTENERRFLTPLLSHMGELVPRERLLAMLEFPDDPYGLHRLETLASRLRRKVLQKTPNESLSIKGRYGYGYTLNS